MSGRGEVICRVRALYPYESNDPASLSFQPHAIIEVLAQLESGWWDGWSNGKRGWFPSNYVEVLRPEEEFDAQEKEPDENQLWELQQQWRFRQQQQMLLQQQQQQQMLLQQQQQQQLLQQQQQQQQLHHLQKPADQQRQRLLDQEMRHRLRMSLHASEMVTPAREIATEQQNSQDSSGWILQTTEDGSEQYYYNTRTQEMRYSIPPEMGMDEKVKQALASTNGPMDDLSSPSPSSPSSPSMNEMQDQYERPPVRPVRAANRALPEDHPYNQHAVSDLPSLLKEELEEEFHDDDTV
ncbi:hypothetical protein [Parasitella parasitica]|uniref:SH3 domain-containing protein n=1 Tax=Parasitella parasitica TaxID=35722 RepID=A0A0B7NXT7_9FUNG|nr:hypothetical protein [Parasitella parasitica]